MSELHQAFVEPVGLDGFGWRHHAVIRSRSVLLEEARPPGVRPAKVRREVPAGAEHEAADLLGVSDFAGAQRFEHHQQNLLDQVGGVARLPQVAHAVSPNPRRERPAERLFRVGAADGHLPSDVSLIDGRAVVHLTPEPITKCWLHCNAGRSRPTPSVSKRSDVKWEQQDET